MVTGGQRNDGAMLAEVLADIRVPRLGSGRPRTRPDVVVADRAYTDGVDRRMLAARGVKTVIPQKNTEIAARLRRGSAGGRAPAFDAEIYKARNVVERSFNLSKQWRGLATRYDKLAITYRAAAVLQACIRWLRLWGDTAQLALRRIAFAQRSSQLSTSRTARRWAPLGVVSPRPPRTTSVFETDERRVSALIPSCSPSRWCRRRLAWSPRFSAHALPAGPCEPRSSAGLRSRAAPRGTSCADIHCHLRGLVASINLGT